MKLRFLPIVVMSMSFLSSGCSDNNSEESPEIAAQSNDDSASPASSVSSSTPKTPNYSEIFDVVVRGWSPDGTDAEAETMDKAYFTIEKFSEQEHRDFIEYMKPKLQDSNPYVRLQAATEIASCRIQYLAEGKQNKDLVPTYVGLLQEKEEMIRQFTLNSLPLFVVKSGLNEELSPLVQPLIENLEHSRTAFKSVGLLGDIGPLASEAIPYIRKAAERDKDEFMDQRTAEAIQKIENSSN